MAIVVAVVLSGLLLMYWRAALAILAIILLAILIVGIATVFGDLNPRPAGAGQRVEAPIAPPAVRGEPV